MRQKRDDSIRVVLSSAEKEAVERLAAFDDGSQSAVVRRLLRREALELGLWPLQPSQGQPIPQAREAGGSGVGL
jgi:hypothetical protein